MTFNSNEEQYQGSAFNPFVPTKRDIARTEELANKNHIVAGLLGFIFPIAAMIYLNRASNNLKMIAYSFVIGTAVGFTFITTNQNKDVEEVIESSQGYNAIGRVFNLLGSIAFMTENGRAVTLARKRQSEAES